MRRETMNNLKNVLSVILSFCVVSIHAFDHHSIKHGIPFHQVILWGHKLHSHTHSYIHWAFKRAFEHLGFTAYWLDNNDDLSKIDLAGSLFITEGSVDQKIPVRPDCFYILHNCDLTKYSPIKSLGRYIVLQTYSNDCLSKKVSQLEDYIFYNLDEKIIYMPWATDLLPHEIDAIKQQLPSIKKEKVVRFVGSRWGRWQGNVDVLDEFSRACTHYGIPFELTAKVEFEDHIRLIKTAYMAPAIQGNWQCEHGYIPCRIFKNISYGQFGVTNSKTVYELFHKKIIYNADPYQLLFDAVKRLESVTMREQLELMDIVRDQHTYLNRINSLLVFASMVYEHTKIQDKILKFVLNDSQNLLAPIMGIYAKPILTIC